MRASLKMIPPVLQVSKAMDLKALKQIGSKARETLASHDLFGQILGYLQSIIHEICECTNDN